MLVYISVYKDFIAFSAAIYTYAATIHTCSKSALVQRVGRLVKSKVSSLAQTEA